jgi:ABC-type transporter Mla subunit MlaD
MATAQQILDAINAVKQNTSDISNKMDDVKGKLDTVNNNLITIEGKLDTLNASVQAVDADVEKVQQLLLWGFQQLITLGQYTNQALFHNDQQNDTMICLLEQISRNTCGIWNEAHTQTELQEGIKAATRKLACLYAATHGDAALTLEREAELRRQIEACCPPEPPEPVCKEKPCPTPRPLDKEPPETEPPPQIGPPPTN